jgi:DNA-binding transcriptional MerR regulator
MNIGSAATQTGLPVKTIRYYEEIGLVTPDRRANGYRDFSAACVEQLRLLAQARHLGFSLGNVGACSR